MSKRLGLLLIRGSGESGFQRQKRFMERLEKDLARRNMDKHLIQHENVDWYEPLQHSQESILERMEEKGVKLKSLLTRNLIIRCYELT